MPPTDEQEIARLQQVCMRALPKVIVGDSKWNAVAAHTLAVELWRDRVRVA
jgi:hypothetical protein